MKDDSDQEGGRNLPSDSGVEFAARRTIVKGMASVVPVVMTIGCGQAMAQGSSLQCIVEPIPPPEHCIKESDTEDPVYVRVDSTQQDCKNTNF